MSKPKNQPKRRRAENGVAKLPPSRPDYATGLTDREWAFVEYYLLTTRIRDAARAAGYAYNSAGVIGQDVISRPHVRAAIDAALSERFSVTKAKIVEQFANVAFFEPKNIFSWDEKGLKIKPSTKLTEAEWSAVSSIRMDSDGRIEIKFYDRLVALEKLSRLTGALRELPSQTEGERVTFVIGDPEPILERYRAQRARQIEGKAEEIISPGEHGDLVIAEPSD